jgi:hypothetical protein
VVDLDEALAEDFDDEDATDPADAFALELV